MKRLSMKGASWDSMFLTAVKIVTTLTSILLTKILSVGLSLESYGTYSQVTVVVTIGTSLLLMGLGDALNYFYNKQDSDAEEKRRRFVHTIFLLETLLGIVFSLLVILGRGVLANYFSNDAIKIVLIVASVKPMMDNLIYFYQILYISIGRAKVIAIRNLLLAISRLISVFVAVHFFQSITMIFALLIVLDVIQLVLFKAFFAKECFCVNIFKASAKQIRPIMAYGLPMGVYALTNMLSRELGKLVIGRMADTETMAIYTNCSKLLPFDIIVVSFATVLIPYIMKYVTGGENQKAVALFRDYMKIGYYSVWIFGVAVLIVAPQMVSFLYSDKYLSGTTVFMLYVVDSMIKFASMHLILTAAGKAKSLMTYSLVCLAFNTILNIVFYRWLGLIGTALATLLVSLLYTLLVLGKSIKTLDTRWRDIFDLRDMLVFSAGLVASAIVCYFGNRLLLQLGIHRFVVMIFICGAYCSINFVINFKKITRALKSINSMKM